MKIKNILLILTLLVVIFGCVEDLEEENRDLGPEFSPDQVSKALAQAIDGSDPSEAITGDYTHLEFNRKIETGSPFKLLDISTEVLQKTDQGDHWEYKLKRVVTTYGDQVDTVEDEVTVDVNKIGGSKLQSLVPNSKVFEKLNVQLSPTPLEDKNKITFHNLTYNFFKKDPPDAVQQKADCGGLDPCELNVGEVVFDMVEWVDDENWEKTQFKYQIAKEVPYFLATNDPFLAKAVSQCARTLVPIEDRKYIVSDCYVLRNFTNAD